MNEQQFKKAYPLLRDISLGKTPRPAGLQQLMKEFGVNGNSAISAVNNFRHLLKGTEYQRVMSKHETGHILKMIGQELGAGALRKALAAVRLHMAYYKKSTGNNQPGIQRIVEGFEATLSESVPEAVAELKKTRDTLEKEGEYDPADDEDEREWVMRLIAKRQGRSEFRDKLLKLYRSRCAISGCPIEYVLEAAHIKGYHGPKSDHSSNGLLLRTDLHTLFDLHLISIDTSSWKVLVSTELKGSIYDKYAGRKLRLPKNRKRWPSVERLNWHRQQCLL